MKIGVVKEIKDNENRVGMTPAGAETLISEGHSVSVEVSAGIGSGFSDQEYIKAGAILVGSKEAWDCDLVVKVKEPLEAEYRYLRQQMLFTFFHLAGVSRSLTETLLERKTAAIAYETLEDEEGKLPLLAPMSAVAGNMSVLMGAYYLASFNDGKGMQLGTVLDQTYGKVVIIGDGIVGQHAAKVADSMGAKVHIAVLHRESGARLKRDISTRVNYFLSSPQNIAAQIKEADLVVGAVLRRGEKALHVVTKSMVKTMQPGSVIVDVSIDQGGCIETSRPTSHADPVYKEHGVIHYCVTNMPGAYPRTSTIALTNSTLSYISQLANGGIRMVGKDRGFSKAVNTFNGYVTYRPVAEALGFENRFADLAALLA